MTALSYGNHRYEFISANNISWFSARTQAENKGGHLVTITSAAENNFIQSNFGGIEDYWIGLSDHRQDGNFEWVTGEQLTYTNWHPGEPNNHDGDEDFVTGNFSGNWNDNDNYITRDRLDGYLIEYDYECEPCNDPPSITIDFPTFHHTDYEFNVGTLDYSSNSNVFSFFSNMLPHTIGGGATQFTSGKDASIEFHLDFDANITFNINVDGLDTPETTGYQSLSAGDHILYLGIGNSYEHSYQYDLTYSLEFSDPVKQLVSHFSLDNIHPWTREYTQYVIGNDDFESRNHLAESLFSEFFKALNVPYQFISTKLGIQQILEQPDWPRELYAQTVSFLIITGSGALAGSPFGPIGAFLGSQAVSIVATETGVKRELLDYLRDHYDNTINADPRSTSTQNTEDNFINDILNILQNEIQFDAEFYLSTYHDAAQSVANGEVASALQHYLTTGLDLEYIPNATETPLTREELAYDFNEENPLLGTNTAIFEIPFTELKGDGISSIENNLSLAINSIRAEDSNLELSSDLFTIANRVSKDILHNYIINNSSQNFINEDTGQYIWSNEEFSINGINLNIEGLEVFTYIDQNATEEDVINYFLNNRGEALSASIFDEIGIGEYGGVWTIILDAHDRQNGRPQNEEIGSFTLYGNGLNNHLWANNNPANLYGLGGDDTLIGGQFDDFIYGGVGHDIIDAGEGQNTINAGDGNDTIRGVFVGDQINGGDGQDTLDLSANRWSGGTLHEINLEEGTASFLGQTAPSGGNFPVTTITSIENIQGASSASISYIGNIDDNIILAGLGNDYISGGGGNDSINGGRGNDYIDGGTGIDLVGYLDSDSGVTVSLNIAGEQNTLGAGLDTLLNIEDLNGSIYDDTLTGNLLNNLLMGLEGDDILFGLSGDDILLADLGNDILSGGGGQDTLYGGEGNDTLYGDISNYIMEIAKFTQEGLAQFGNDIIYGDAGNDRIESGIGDDYIDGGTGNDILSGWGGNDTFVFGNNFGHDIIEDFSTKNDVIDFSKNTLINSFDDIIISNYTNNTIITTDDGTITLEGDYFYDIRESDFIF